MFFDGWFGLLRVLIVGSLAYISLVIVLRGTGKRTLSKLSAFDLVVTVALGSTLATVLLSKDVALGEGIAAFALLSGLQFVITWSSVRSARVRRLVKSEPRLLVSRGEPIESAMREERVTLEEILATMRASGHLSLGNLDAVVLETDGSLSVVASSEQGVPHAGLEGPNSERRRGMPPPDIGGLLLAIYDPTVGLGEDRALEFMRLRPDFTIAVQLGWFAFARGVLRRARGKIQFLRRRLTRSRS